MLIKNKSLIYKKSLNGKVHKKNIKKKHNFFNNKVIPINSNCLVKV